MMAACAAACAEWTLAAAEATGGRWPPDDGGRSIEGGLEDEEFVRSLAAAVTSRLGLETLPGLLALLLYLRALLEPVGEVSAGVAALGLDAVRCCCCCSSLSADDLEPDLSSPEDLAPSEPLTLEPTPESTDLWSLSIRRSSAEDERRLLWPVGGGSLADDAEVPELCRSRSSLAPSSLLNFLSLMPLLFLFPGLTFVHVTLEDVLDEVGGEVREIVLLLRLVAVTEILLLGLLLVLVVELFLLLLLPVKHLVESTFPSLDSLRADLETKVADLAVATVGEGNLGLLDDVVPEAPDFAEIDPYDDGKDFSSPVEGAEVPADFFLAEYLDTPGLSASSSKSYREIKSFLLLELFSPADASFL